MEGFPRQAVLLTLLEEMRIEGSWCGETHVQKCVYFLEVGLHVPMGLGFILYKHGPFSFDLREILGEMRGNFLIDVESRSPFGASLAASDSGRRLASRFPRTTQRYRPQINFVAERLANRRVAELERLGTALYVTKERPHSPVAERAAQIVRLKPHVLHEQAEQAVEEVDALLHDAPRLT